VWKALSAECVSLLAFGASVPPPAKEFLLFKKQGVVCE